MTLYTLWHRTMKFGRITQVGRGVFLGSHSRLRRNGAGHQRSRVLGLPSISAYTLGRRSNKFDLVTHMWRMLLFRGSATPSPQGRDPAKPKVVDPAKFIQLPVPCSGKHYVKNPGASSWYRSAPIWNDLMLVTRPTQQNIHKNLITTCRVISKIRSNIYTSLFDAKSHSIAIQK